MPYLVQASTQQLAELFNVPYIVTRENTRDGMQTIAKDLPRTPFFGSLMQAQQHIKQWQQSTNAGTYCQGNICAGNSSLFINTFLFKGINEPVEEWSEQYARHSFAYINNEQKLCGLTFCYRKDDPTQWFIAVAEHTELAPQDRTLTFLASFDLNACINKNTSVVVELVDRLNNKLIKQLKSTFLQNLITSALQADEGQINHRLARIQWLLRTPNPNNLQIDDPIQLDKLNAQLLLADNRVLDLLSQYEIHLPFAMLDDCLAETSGLRQAIESLNLTSERLINICLLQMTVNFYAAHLLNGQYAILDELFKRVHAGFILDEVQIALVPFLVRKKYSAELIRLILSDRVYYHTVAELVTLGLTQDIAQLFSNNHKLKELEELSSIKDKKIMQMCLIFWFKGTIPLAEYSKLIAAGNAFPLLAETVIALDKRGELSLEQLKSWALVPKKQLLHSILHHYAAELPINEQALQVLDEVELERLSRACSIVSSKKELFELCTRNNPQGYLLRLFLSSFTAVANQEHRSILVDLLYIGVRKGSISLSKQVSALQNPELKVHAENLQERLLCAKTLHNLKFSDELISFVAGVTPISARLRDVILKVEQQCKVIHARLLRENKPLTQKNAWQNAEHLYRKNLYQLAYQALKNPGVDFKACLKQEQEKILKCVDPEIKSWAYQAVMLIANVFITALTLGLANQIKYHKTGNMWFFNQSNSGEELRALERDVLKQIGPFT